MARLKASAASQRRRGPSRMASTLSQASGIQAAAWTAPMCCVWEAKKPPS